VLLIRPENMAIEVSGETTRVPGRLEDSILLGGVVRHFLRCADGTSLIVQELNQPGRSVAHRGDLIQAGWRPGHARLLPPQPGN
jgi:putative spermidine/putrescine transport system ATP-binding protein